MTAADEPDERPYALRLLYPRRPPREAVIVPLVAGEGTRRYGEKALASELEKLGAAPEGERNDQLNLATYNLAQLVASGHLEHGDTWRVLEAAGLAVGLTAGEVRATMGSAFRAGSLQPRLVSELDNDPVPPVTVLEDPDLLDGVLPDEPPTLRERFPALDWADLWADESEEEWIVEPLLPARRLVALFSPPKVGKSLLMLELAMQVSRGLSAFGAKLDRPRRVLYIDFENDPRGDIRSRLQAMGVDHSDLADLVYLSFPRLAYLDTAIGGLELMAVVEEYRCEVVVIDTISRAVGGEENANDTWLGFYRNTGLRLKAAGVACIRLDHTGKDETKGMRGGSAKYGDVDAVWAMSRVTDDVYRLECTANRLPIAEKVLVLHRRLHPLRHEVDAAGVTAAIVAKREAMIETLDALLGKGVGTKVDPAIALLKAHGQGARRSAVVSALEVRAMRWETQPPLLETEGP